VTLRPTIFITLFPSPFHWEATFQNGDQAIKKNELQQWKDDSDGNREVEDRKTQKAPAFPIPLLFLFLITCEDRHEVSSGRWAGGRSSSALEVNYGLWTLRSHRGP